jgi:hypothetical protein
VTDPRNETETAMTPVGIAPVDVMPVGVSLAGVAPVDRRWSRTARRNVDGRG